MKELEKMLNLGEEYKIDKQEEKKENNKVIKVIYVSCKKKIGRCPRCDKYTSSIHDKLKSIELKYLKNTKYNFPLLTYFG